MWAPHRVVVAFTWGEIYGFEVFIYLAVVRFIVFFFRNIRNLASHSKCSVRVNSVSMDILLNRSSPLGVALLLLIFKLGIYGFFLAFMFEIFMMKFASYKVVLIFYIVFCI